jgi:hypothetical protein
MATSARKRLPDCAIGRSRELGGMPANVVRKSLAA